MRVNYLRISVTDRCNLRCVYCRPRHDCDFIERAEILSYEEIHRLVRLFVDCGVDRVRLTGGEPLVRRGVASLVARVARTRGISEVALTTNGVLLASMAEELKAAGLDRVNVSLDSLAAENYRRITGSDCLPQVLRGIHRAAQAGLLPVKINAVILRRINAAQILALAGLSLDLPVAVRFIEYCPTGRDIEPADDYVPYTEVRAIIEREFGRLSDAVAGPGNGPAAYFKISGSAGTIGFIAGRSTMFCPSCNRIRLTSDGRIRPCLYSAFDYNVKRLLRGGASDEKVRSLLAEIIARKGSVNKLDALATEFCMRKVGG
jgi:cyclic pyranopterin phosphate synthase